MDALAAGHRVFGENRVQEAQARWSALRKNYSDLRLHLIGPLQTNKVADAVELFDVIETLDREKLARSLAQEMQKQNKKIPCFIQVNTGDEEQKSGISATQLPEFLSFCLKDCGLTIEGLMCIPPVDEAPRKHFSFLARLARENNLPSLSMGMSDDYAEAIKEGATSVRLGTALFGTRPE